jgi:exoribonuclease R
MVVSRSGALKSARFYPAVMRSAARLTYTLANDALFTGRPAARTQLGQLLERLMVLVMSTARSTRRAATGVRSISMRRKPSSSSMRASGCALSSCAYATTRTGSSRSA